MKASEIMLEGAVTLTPDMMIPQAAAHARQSTLDILPVVDKQGQYRGSVSKAALVGNLQYTNKRVEDACCADALVCAPGDPMEDLAHDAQSAVGYQSVMIVDGNNQFCGVVPHVHWAVDEARTQSGYPSNYLEARTVLMHLIYKCLECGELIRRNEGVPPQCPNCGASPDAISLYTED